MSDSSTEGIRAKEAATGLSASSRLGEQVAVLSTLASIVCRPLTLRETLESALDEVVGCLNLRAAWICLHEGQPSDLGRALGRCDSEEAMAARKECVWYRSSGSGGSDRGQHTAPPTDVAESICPAVEHFRNAGQAIVFATQVSPCGAAGALRAEGSTLLACAPLQCRTKFVGVLSLVGEEPDAKPGSTDLSVSVLTAIGRQIGIAIENLGLLEELHRAEEFRRRLLARMLALQEEERRRIARELHDHMGQSLTSLIVTLRILGEATSPEEVSDHLQKLRDTVGQILEEMHELAFELRPAALDDLGLLPTLRHFLRGYRDRYRLFVDLQVLGLGDDRLPPSIETALYRIIQEALANVVRHAQAGGVTVLLEKRSTAMMLIVEDDGIGFDVNQVMDTGSNAENLGLYGMREQAALLGGTLAIEATPGVGTALFVTVPLTQGGADDGKDPHIGGR